LNTRVDKPDVFRLTVTMAKQRPSHTSSFGNPQSIKKIQEIEYKGYVYDVTTYNHHFQAGPGKMIVHNTDSCLITNDNIKKCDMIKLGQQICAEITAQLPSPMALMFESYCDKAILLTKKRYVLVSSDKITYKGVMTARRDYCKYAKDLYKGVIGMITAGKHSDEIASYLDIQILKLVLGKCDVSELVITKSISRDLKSYVVNQPQVVLAKRLQDETGVDVPAGTRLEYVFVKEGNNQAEKMRTIEEFKSSSEFTIDGKYYVKKQLVNQIDDILSLIGLEKYIKNNWLSLL
jgi:DNA polymerase delta subunit 1